MHPLTQKLSSLRRQLVLRQRAAAACWTAATVLVTAIALGTVDYLVRFADPGLRIMATFALVSAAMWAVYRWWYTPSRNQLATLAVARRVETHFPQLRDILASSMEFLEQSEEDRTAGSAQLRRLVVAEAQSAVERLPLDDVIDRGPLRRAVKWLAIPVIVVIVLLACDASAVGTAVRRLVAPLGSTQWPRTHHLAFREVPKRMAAGQTFEVELIDTAGPLPDDVRIEFRMSDRQSRESTNEAMTRAGDVMVARRENVRQSFAFRAVGGDDHTMPWHWVGVVEPPRLEAFSVIAYPPAYTGLPSASAGGHLEVLAGSGLEVRGTANESLSAARILIESTPPIAATIGADKPGDDRRKFRVNPEQWIASESGTYRVELSDADGMGSVVEQWNLRVQPDPPPSVSWTRPKEDLYVTAAALVPIEVSVTDNLAIERVELLYEHAGTRSDAETNQAPREATESRINIYRGPPKPVVKTSDAGVPEGATRHIEYQWNLISLQLHVGTELICQIEAADYRPGTGHTAAPRRITIISNDELNARLADHQARIVRQLERALAAQRTTREDVRRLEIQQQQSRAISKGERVTLQTAEIDQRHVGTSLVDPHDGVLGTVSDLLSEIAINQVSATDVHAAMDRVLAELDQLSSGPLNVAESKLVTARKTVDGIEDPSGDSSRDSTPLDVATAERMPALLAAAGAAQDEVIASLERLINELSGSTNVRQLARQLAELRHDQIAHEQMVRAEIGLATLPLQQNELSRAQRASLEKAAVGQSAIATRFENIVQTIDQVARAQSAKDAKAAETATHAVDLARRLTIATNMQETSRDLAGNRVGQALSREAQIAADLEKVLEALGGGSTSRPNQLANQLRQAEESLARLRQQLASLRQRVAHEEQRPDGGTGTPQLSQLANSQQQLHRETEQLADELKRLQATDASESTQNAANRLTNPSGNNKNAKPTRPAPSRDVQQAEKDLEQAARQLANQRQQQENDLALELVRRFQAELVTMVERQKSVIHDTVQLHAARKPDISLDEPVTQTITGLALEERALEKLAAEHGELLSGFGAVQMGLEEAQRRLAASAARLDSGDTGSRTQQAEQYALARLEGMLQAFAQTTSESAPNPNAPTGNNSSPSGEQPQRRPTFELLEVKVLRMLQVDLNERTRVLEDRLAELNQPLEGGERSELARESQELQAEQRRLAELVREMLTRDNGEGSQ